MGTVQIIEIPQPHSVSLGFIQVVAESKLISFHYEYSAIVGMKQISPPLPTHPLEDTQFISTLGKLQIGLLKITMYGFLCGHTFSCLWGAYTEMELFAMKYMPNSVKNLKHFSMGLSSFAFSPVVYERFQLFVLFCLIFPVLEAACTRQLLCP